MGGFFGAASKRDVVIDVYFGVDYHSHLGTRRAGLIIVGGIVDGRQITDLDEPITSSTNSIIAFNDKSNIPKYRKELI